MHDDFYSFVCKELEELDEKAQRGDVSLADVQYADLLEHYKKSVLTNDAMSGEGDYSERNMPRYAYEGEGGGGINSYARGGRSYRGGNSYARGRGRNAKRDSMGRYAREGGYSYAEEVDNTMTEMKEMIKGLPEDKKRKIIAELEG